MHALCTTEFTVVQRSAPFDLFTLIPQRRFGQQHKHFAGNFFFFSCYVLFFFKFFPENVPAATKKWRLRVSMDVEWSTVLESEHPWYRGVALYSISRSAAHNSESQQRYLNCRDLENSIWEFYEEEEESVTEVIGVLYTQETSVMLWSGTKSN